MWMRCDRAGHPLHLDNSRGVWGKESPEDKNLAVMGGGGAN